MKDIHKNPVVYYIAIPVIVALWPILVRGVYIPAAQVKLEKEIADYTDANNKMLDILTLSPERLGPTDPNQETVEFAYDRAIFEVASLCNIPPSKWKYESGTRTSKTQSAKVTLSNIDITSIAKFLSTIQARWPKLVCNIIRLTKKPNIPDEWNITIDFNYYYTSLD